MGVSTQCPFLLRVTGLLYIPTSASQTNRQSRPIKPMWNLKRGIWPVMTRLYPASKSALSTAKSGAWTTGKCSRQLGGIKYASFSASLVPRTWSQEAEGKVCSSIQGSEASRHSLSLKSCVMQSWLQCLKVLFNKRGCLIYWDHMQWDLRGPPILGHNRPIPWREPASTTRNKRAKVMEQRWADCRMTGKAGKDRFHSFIDSPLIS